MVYPTANLRAMAIKNWNNWNAVILHTVHISNTETLASKFVTLRAKFVDPVVGKWLWKRMHNI